MANICSNELHITCAECDVSIVEDYMKETFPSTDCYYEELMGDESQVEFYFDSRWDFPEERMNELVKKLTKPECFYGSCLSVEWGNYYCAFHSGDESGWRYER